MNESEVSITPRIAHKLNKWGEPERDRSTTGNHVISENAAFVPQSVIKLDFDPKTLSESDFYLYERIDQFVNELLVNFHRKMQEEMLAMAKEENSPFSHRLALKMRRKKYDLPKISILHGNESAQSFLAANPKVNNSYASRLNHRFLVVFNLPDPLMKFWRQGGEKESGARMAVPVSEGEIEWGKFYRRVMPEVHKTINLYEAPKGPLQISKLNGAGVHTKQFYYVWSMDFPKQDEDEEEYY